VASRTIIHDDSSWLRVPDSSRVFPAVAVAFRRVPSFKMVNPTGGRRINRTKSDEITDGREREREREREGRRRTIFPDPRVELRDREKARTASGGSSVARRGKRKGVPS